MDPFIPESVLEPFSITSNLVQFSDDAWFLHPSNQLKFKFTDL